MIQSGNSFKSFETAIIGGGVLGLWAARHAIKRGEEVILLEKRQVGGGASSGFLGALMPHMPDVWNDKKQMQYNGLSTIGSAVADLEADTGIDCGFRRCGRLMPLQNDRILPQIEKRKVGSRDNWAGEYELGFMAGSEITRYSKLNWVDPAMAPSGVQYDTLSARINPRAYLEALDAFVRPRSTIEEICPVAAIKPQKSGGTIRLEFADNTVIAAEKVIVANGWEAYTLLQPYFDAINNGNPMGRGVKGQALLVRFKHEDDLPIVYHDGIYVVPHSGNRVAIGSTSENHWIGEPDSFDTSNLEFYKRAVEVVPVLRSAPIVGRWAGVRPRNTLEGRGTTPWLGPVPNQENLFALIGGFKITLGIAHLDYVEHPTVI